MSLYKQGDTVRTKDGGPVMTVDGYTPSGDVLCTYWVKDHRRQEPFVEATLEAVSLDDAKPKIGGWWLGKKR